MSRFSDNYKDIVWGNHPLPERRSRATDSGPTFVPDIAPFRSPMSGRILSSRKHVRDEERAYNVRQCGELKSPTDFDNSPRLNEGFNERRFDSAFRTALEKAGL